MWVTIPPLPCSSLIGDLFSLLHSLELSGAHTHCLQTTWLSDWVPNRHCTCYHADLFIDLGVACVPHNITECHFGHGTLSSALLTGDQWYSRFYTGHPPMINWNTSILSVYRCWSNWLGKAWRTTFGAIHSDLCLTARILCLRNILA